MPEMSDPAEPGEPAGGTGSPVDPEGLFRRNYRKVYYRFLAWKTRPDEAEDLTQETFLRAYRGIADFRADASESTWLFEIAHNVFKNYLRDKKAKKRDAPEVSLDAKTSGEEKDGPTPEPTDADPLPLELVLDAENKRLLRQAIEKLPPQRRQAVELRLQGLRYNEIAPLMGLSIETVKSHLHQAREALRKELGAGGG